MRNHQLIKVGLRFLLFSFISLFSACYEKPCHAADTAVETQPDGGLALHVWDRYVRKFRRDHNLGINLGYAFAKWHVVNLGDIGEASYWVEQASTTIDYTFHILISGKTGYFLGTSAGYTFVRPEKYRDQFQPSTSWLLPGIRAGLVYNYDASGRVFAGVGAQLERFNDIKTHRATGEWQSISVTGESFQMLAGIDLFFSLDSAVHFAWVDTSTYVPKPDESDDYLVRARIGRRVQGAEIGFLTHFL
jgi:hypothetical protein